MAVAYLTYVFEDGVAQVVCKSGGQVVFVDREGHTVLGLLLALDDVELELRHTVSKETGVERAASTFL